MTAEAKFKAGAKQAHTSGTIQTVPRPSLGLLQSKLNSAVTGGVLVPPPPTPWLGLGSAVTRACHKTREPGWAMRVRGGLSL